MSNALIEETQEYWEDRTGEAISPGDANQTLNNMVRFFDLLDEWDRAAREDEPIAGKERSANDENEGATGEMPEHVIEGEGSRK